MITQKWIKLARTMDQQKKGNKKKEIRAINWLLQKKKLRKRRKKKDAAEINYQYFVVCTK